MEELCCRQFSPLYISGGDRDNDGTDATNGDDEYAQTGYELIILGIWRLSIMIILHFAQLKPIMEHGQRANGCKQLPGMMRVIDPMTSA
jgi:hypothetical protein